MFDFLNKILFKTKKPDTTNIQECEEFVPYMVHRWCSMYSPEVCNLLNVTSNRHWPTLTDRGMWFDYLYTVIPSCRFRRIGYIKKKKDTEEKVKNKETVAKIANNLEISVREVNEYIKHFKLDIPNEQQQKR